MLCPKCSRGSVFINYDPALDLYECECGKQWETKRGKTMEPAIVRYDEETTVDRIKAQIQTIQEVMAAVMKKDVHYGTIPGTSKPTLYKPGSEKILATFRIAVEPRDIKDLSVGEEIRYRVRVYGVTSDGTVVGVGVGEASSDEEKYRWRKPVCDEEFDDTPSDRKREVWKKPYQKEPYKAKQVRMNPADIANTILKMAKKRAQIDMTLTATAASDVFEQDLDDMDEATRAAVLTRGKETKTTLQKPKEKTEGTKKKDKNTTPKAPAEQVTVEVKEVLKREGKNAKGKDFTLYIVQSEDTEYLTFSESFANIAKEAKESGAPALISFTINEYGSQIETIEPAREAGGDDS